MTVRLSSHTLAGLIDLSAVQAFDDDDALRRTVAAAERYGCKSVIVLPSRIPFTRMLFGENSPVLLGGCVGFPAGGVTTAVKIFETKEHISMGCTEIDMMINLGKLLSGRYDEVCEDIHAVVEAAPGKPVKVILECHYLTEDLIRKACELSIEAGAHFVKTGTGWAPTGATLENIAIIKSQVGERIAIKAAGGVRGLDDMVEMIRMGVTRFGMSAKTAVKILEQVKTSPGGTVEI